MKISYKNIVKTITGIVTAFLIVLVLTLYFKSQQDFQEKMDVISKTSDDGWFSYQYIFGAFFIEKFRYPKDFEELSNFFKEDTSAFEVFNSKMKDPFSRQHKDLLYVPVYSKANKLCEGFLLISAGIDGKIDNQIEDSVYFETVKDLRFYNTLKVATSLSYRRYNVGYKLKDYLFGNKDLLVEYANGIDIYLNNFTQGEYTPAMLMKSLNLTKAKRYKRFQCIVNGIVKQVEGSTAILADNTCKVTCDLYKGCPIKIKVGDSVKIMGEFKDKFDLKTNTVFLDNCIVVGR